MISITNEGPISLNRIPLKQITISTNEVIKSVFKTGCKIIQIVTISMKLLQKQAKRSVCQSLPRSNFNSVAKS